MCGIAGVILRNSMAGKILTQMLINLEYRGYDSCGIAIINSGCIEIKKDVRKEKESMKSSSQNYLGRRDYFQMKRQRSVEDSTLCSAGTV